MKGSKLQKTFARFLAMHGCISTGMVYGAVGVIAILSFLKIKKGGADEGSLLVYLNDYLVGKIFVWIILAGILSYIAWRMYETFRDPYDYGTKVKGLIRRSGIGLSSIADAFIAYSAIQALLGTGSVQEDGQPKAEREIAAKLFQENWGDGLVIILGAIILITALVQFFYGISKGYKERLNIDHFSKLTTWLTHFLAWFGYFSRGIILGIIGFFFIKAGILEDAQFVVNTDKAFDFIGDHVGHFYFIFVAAGTICYGLFMFLLGIYFDPDKD